MTYSVKIGDMTFNDLNYSELINLPLDDNTFIRRGNDSNWMHVSDCLELSHIEIRHSPAIVHRQEDERYNIPETYDYGSEEDYDEEDYDEDDYDEDDDTELRSPYPQYSQVSNNGQGYNQEYYERQEFLPTAEYFKCKQKRKAATIGICTLGLAGTSLIGLGNIWQGNIFEGTSFATGGIGFVLKCLSFCLFTALIAIPYFVYSVLALIYYSIRLHSLKER